jgi:hypothetical protein
MIDFVGKSLLIDRSVLVLSDLHLGYGGALENSGVMVPVDVYQEIFSELEEIFNNVKKIETIVLLGDVKHVFGSILNREWNEVLKLFDYLQTKCERVVIVRGNHDNILAPLAEKKNILIENVFIWKNYALFHGNKDFEEIHDKKINTWIMGHLHPAVTLVSGAKSEKYKCFLDGKYKKKRVIVLPSFFPFSEGSDPRESGGLVWKVNFNNFIVRIVGEDLNVLEFGKLKNISYS